jgi:S1-C subfamily serine protease
MWRAGKEQEVSATVAAWPNFMPRGGVMTGQAAAKMMEMEPHPGVSLAAITEADRKQYGLGAAQTGVLITKVEPDCEASDFGVVPGDVITSVQDAPVAAPDQVWSAVKTAYQQHQAYLAVLIQTKAGAQWLPISIGR